MRGVREVLEVGGSAAIDRSEDCRCFHAACIMRNVYPLLFGDMRYSFVLAQQQ